MTAHLRASFLTTSAGNSSALGLGASWGPGWSTQEQVAQRPGHLEGLQRVVVADSAQDGGDLSPGEHLAGPAEGEGVADGGSPHMLQGTLDVQDRKSTRLNSS